MLCCVVCMCVCWVCVCVWASVYVCVGSVVLSTMCSLVECALGLLCALGLCVPASLARSPLASFVPHSFSVPHTSSLLSQSPYRCSGSSMG